MRSFGITNAAPYAAAPAVGASGDTYWNTATKVFYVSDGTAWVPWPSGGGGAADSTYQTINQVGHGLALGDVVRYSGTAYVKAQADTEPNAEVVGMVRAVWDANSFSLHTSGYIAGLSGFTAGTAYYLSATTPGALTAIEPVTAGQVSKPLFVAVGTTNGFFHNWRGSVIPALPASQWPVWSYNGTTAVSAAGQWSINPVPTLGTASTLTWHEQDSQAVSRYYQWAGLRNGDSIVVHWPDFGVWRFDLISNITTTGSAPNRILTATGMLYRLSSTGTGGTVGQLSAHELVLSALVAQSAFVRRYRSVAQTLNNGAWTAIDFDSIRQQQDASFLIGWNSSQRGFTFVRSGVYLFTFTNVGFGTTGRRVVMFSTDGATTGEWTRNAVQNLSTAGAGLAHSDVRYCVPGDCISALMYQDSGAGVNIAMSPWDFTCTLLGTG